MLSAEAADDCACPACTQYDRAYLRHLMETEEPLGPRLLALHNLTFLMALMASAREHLSFGDFGSWSAHWFGQYRSESGRP